MSAKTTLLALCGWMGAAAVFGDQACKDDSALKFLAHVEDGVQLMQISASMPAEKPTHKAVDADVMKKTRDAIAHVKKSYTWSAKAKVLASAKKKHPWLASERTNKAVPVGLKKILDAIASEKASKIEPASVKASKTATASGKTSKAVPADVMKKIQDAIASKKKFLDAIASEKANKIVPASVKASKTAVASEKTSKTLPADVMKNIKDAIASKKKIWDAVASETTNKMVPASAEKSMSARRRYKRAPHGFNAVSQ